MVEEVGRLKQVAEDSASYEDERQRRSDERREKAAREHGERRQGAPRPQVLEELLRIAAMRQRRLHPALEPQSH